MGRRADCGLLARQVVRIYKAFYGRGPPRAAVERVSEDTMVCRLREVLTPSDQILVAHGRSDLVVEARHTVHPAMLPALAAAAEDATGREVRGIRLSLDVVAGTAVEEFTLGDLR